MPINDTPLNSTPVHGELAPPPEYAVPIADVGTDAVPIGLAGWPRDTLLTDAIGSDIWPVTWDDVGDLITGWGDGYGFAEGGTLYSYGLSKLVGPPASYTPTDLLYGPTGYNNGKIGSIICVGGVYYLDFNTQSGGPPPTHQLYKSTNHGTSISPVAGQTWPKSEQPLLVNLGFVQQGQDHDDAIDSYLYAAAGEEGGSDQGFLLRIPLASIETLSTWEIFTGTVATPAWDTDWTDGVPGIIPNTVILEPTLGIFIGVDGGFFTGPMVFSWAPKPWGPWTEFARFPTALWEGRSADVAIFLAPKWSDTAGVWMFFSGGGGQARGWDRFNTVKFGLRLGPLSEWTDQAGRKTNLYRTMSEAANPDDANYVTAPVPPAEDHPLEVKLGRLGGTASTGVLRVRLKHV